MAILMNYTVQRKDEASGKTGCFIFDTGHWQKTGEFVATSPVFADLSQFFSWDNENGRSRKSLYLELNA